MSFWYPFLSQQHWHVTIEQVANVSKARAYILLHAVTPEHNPDQRMSPTKTLGSVPQPSANQKGVAFRTRRHTEVDGPSRSIRLGLPRSSTDRSRPDEAVLTADRRRRDDIMGISLPGSSSRLTITCHQQLAYVNGCLIHLLTSLGCAVINASLV